MTTRTRHLEPAMSQTRSDTRWPALAGTRRGSAVFLVLIITVALAALAGSAVLLASGGSLVAGDPDGEHDMLYGAQAALQSGISDLNANPFVLPASGYTQIAHNAT